MGLRLVSQAGPDGEGAGLHHTVEGYARRFPDRFAVVDGTSRLTYRELDRWAGRWAADLIRHGIGPGRLVPILLPKQQELIVAILAVLKTGAAYAALDPTLPAARRAALLAELEPPLVIGPATGSWPAWMPPESGTADFESSVTGGSAPCTVFFTSGTTGRPKGVLSSHRATVRLFGPDGVFDAEQPPVLPLAGPAGWDAFSLELWGALLTGGTSVIVHEPYLSAGFIRAAVPAHGLTAAWLTSSLFNMLVEEDLDAFAGLRRVLIGGEKLSARHVRAFLNRHPTIELTNGYGPVESTVFVATHRITAADCDAPDGIPLGRPVPATQIFVLGPDNKPCRTGETGEIVIAGDGLALRYLDGDRGGFQTLSIDEAPRRVYRSGDLGWWDAAGLLHYGGRADRQVKIRGFRVEPAEVERLIVAAIPEIRDCRVIARRPASGAETELLAWCIPHAPADELATVLPRLAARLPGYMMPLAVTPIATFPLTGQGKLDERSLLAKCVAPVPDQPAAVGAAEPLGSIPATVQAVLAEILELDNPPMDRSFFELGGSSLAAGRLSARLSTRLARPVPVPWIYELTTGRALAERLADGTVEEPVSPDHDACASAEQPLSGMQLVYLTRYLLDPADLTSHCLLTWELAGPVDRAALQEAVDSVHRRYASLRTAFEVEPHPAAFPVDLPAPLIVDCDPAHTAEAAINAVRIELSRELSVFDGELWRVAMAPVAGTDVAILGCVVHHISFDGRSESVLADELSQAYRAAIQESPVDELFGPALPAGQQDWASDAERQRQRRLREAELAGVPAMRWPAGWARVAAGGLEHCQTPLGTELSSAVDLLAASAGVTRFSVLLAHWAAAVAELTGQQDFAVGVPVSLPASLDPAIGCWINTVCVRLRGEALAGDQAAWMEVGRAAGRAFAGANVPLSELLHLAGSHDPGRPPLFQIMFALQDNPIPELNLAGIRSAFRRQPYLDLPLELHAEVWVEPDGLTLVVSHRRDAIAAGTSRQLAEAFRSMLADSAERVRSLEGELR